MANELEFDKKPRRMTDPPQNQDKWLPGYEGVEVKLETDPARIAYFAREATWGDIMREPTPEELADTLAEVAGGKVLSAAKRGGFGFRIRASRSSMDQLLRLAEGSGGAGSGAGAQTTRDNDMRHFNVIVPNTINNLQVPNELHPFSGTDPSKFSAEEERQLWDKDKLWVEVNDLVSKMREVYGKLVDAGVPPQDARYVALPLGFQTQWMHVMDLRALEKLCEQRLCNGLTQHESDYLVRLMRDEVVKLHPWTDKMLRSNCEKNGQCAKSTMLFPACGAFDREPNPNAEYDPDKHLYPADQNDAQQFAEWDVDRGRHELTAPDTPFSFAGDPVPLVHRRRPLPDHERTRRDEAKLRQVVQDEMPGAFSAPPKPAHGGYPPPGGAGRVGM